MCVHACVCMCLFIVCVCVCMHACVRLCVRACVHMYFSVCILCVCVYVCVCMHIVCVRVSMCVYVLYYYKLATIGYCMIKHYMFLFVHLSVCLHVHAFLGTVLPQITYD